MAKLVVKSDGSKIPFEKAKIERGIRRAANDAKMNPEEINKLLQKVSGTIAELAIGENDVASKVIREKILAKLDEVAPAVSSEWRKFDQNKK